jgi:hypothetical protein
MPFASAAAYISAASAALSASGFSQSTCLPASMASIVCSLCNDVMVPTYTCVRSIVQQDDSLLKTEGCVSEWVARGAAGCARYPRQGCRPALGSCSSQSALLSNDHTKPFDSSARPIYVVDFECVPKSVERWMWRTVLLSESLGGALRTGGDGAQLRPRHRSEALRPVGRDSVALRH